MSPASPARLTPVIGLSVVSKYEQNREDERPSLVSKALCGGTSTVGFPDSNHSSVGFVTRTTFSCQLDVTVRTDVWPDRHTHTDTHTDI